MSMSEYAVFVAWLQTVLNAADGQVDRQSAVTRAEQVKLVQARNKVVSYLIRPIWFLIHLAHLGSPLHHNQYSRRR